ncbi:hypothetical protein L2E82_19517 [Cichorium intybus]|uniref:Uncharacterized protein n=1 Tax=Cichorium intybus TaxID=13427 RepID=A0ACB9FDI0_CICIN|nr:hypothetical protein L2E82_19517 [Cichorium intybus]
MFAQPSNVKTAAQPELNWNSNGGGRAVTLSLLSATDRQSSLHQDDPPHAYRCRTTPNRCPIDEPLPEEWRWIWIIGFSMARRTIMDLGSIRSHLLCIFHFDFSAITTERLTISNPYYRSLV